MKTIEPHLRKRLIEDYGYQDEGSDLIKYTGGSDIGLRVSFPLSKVDGDKARLEFGVFSDLLNRAQVETGVAPEFQAAHPITLERGGMAGRPTYRMCGDPNSVGITSDDRYMTLADVDEYLAEWMPQVEACAHVDYIIEWLKFELKRLHFQLVDSKTFCLRIVDHLIRGWGPNGEQCLEEYDQWFPGGPDGQGGRIISDDAVRAFAEKHPDGIERPYYSKQGILARNQLVAAGMQFYLRRTAHRHERALARLAPVEGGAAGESVPVSLGREFLEALWYDNDPKRTTEMLSVLDGNCGHKTEIDSIEFGDVIAQSARGGAAGFFHTYDDVQAGDDLTRDIDLRTVGLSEEDPLFHELHPWLSTGEELFEKYALWLDSWVDKGVANPLCLMELNSYSDCHNAIIVPVENIDRLQALIADYENIVLTKVNPE